MPPIKPHPAHSSWRVRNVVLVLGTYKKLEASGRQTVASWKTIASSREAMPANPDHPTAKAQVKIKRREAFVRDCEQSRQMPTVQAFKVLVDDLFDPQRGFSTKSPKKDRKWFDRVNARISPADLRKHVEHKQSLAVTWGPNARVRVLDADAHGKDSPLDALPTLWDAIRALHIGRGKWLGPLVDGAIPDSVELDGAIVTSPNGLHYIERTEAPWNGDTLRADVARVTACLREQCVDVRPGVLEVLPSPNGQSRLPLGHGCTFVHPSLGAVDVVTGVELLGGLQPVSRTFDALGEGHRWEDVARVDAIEDEPSWLEQFGDTEHFESTDVVTPPKRRPTWRKRNPQTKGETLYEGRGSSGERSVRSGKSAFVEKMERVLLSGASTGLRNSQFWELCILHRCTWGLTREDSEARITTWMENARHTSKDLSDATPSARRSAKRLVHRHLDRIDAGLASGRFFQLGARKTDAPNRDPLLMQAELSNELGELETLGHEFLRGTALLQGLPEWMTKAVPRIIGGIVKWSRNGRIAIPTSALERYAGTKKSKPCPFTGEMRPSYQILRDALQRFGVIGGLLVAPNRGTRLAGVYESNVGRDIKPENSVVVVAWPKHRNVRRKDAPWRQSAIVGCCAVGLRSDVGDALGNICEDFARLDVDHSNLAIIDVKKAFQVVRVADPDMQLASRAQSSNGLRRMSDRFDFVPFFGEKHLCHILTHDKHDLVHRPYLPPRSARSMAIPLRRLASSARVGHSNSRRSRRRSLGQSEH